MFSLHDEGRMLAGGDEEGKGKGDELVRLEVDRVGVEAGEEAEVELDGDLLVDGDGTAAVDEGEVES